MFNQAVSMMYMQKYEIFSEKNPVGHEIWDLKLDNIESGHINDDELLNRREVSARRRRPTRLKSNHAINFALWNKNIQILCWLIRERARNAVTQCGSALFPDITSSKTEIWLVWWWLGAKLQEELNSMKVLIISRVLEWVKKLNSPVWRKFFTA